MTFKRGDFIEVGSPSSNLTQIVRLDHILLHNFDRARRLFITATNTIIRDEYDPILGAGYRRGNLRNEHLIVGLPAIYACHHTSSWSSLTVLLTWSSLDQMPPRSLFGQSARWFGSAVLVHGG